MPRIAPLVVALAASCSRAPAADAGLSAAERSAIGDSIRAVLVEAYRFDGQNPVPRFMSLYADSGPVISAASGGFTSHRDSLRQALDAFWTGTGRFMQQPTWTWGTMAIDVLSREAAVVTARYTIPHWTPAGRPHVLGGAWTTVWARRDGRWVIVQEHLSDLPRPVAERVEATMPAAPPPR